MTRGQLPRIRALAFLVLFLLGGGGLTEVDALVWHRHAAPGGVPVTHFENPDTAFGHSDSCLLGRTVATTRQSPPNPTIAHVAPLSTTPSRSLAPAPLRSRAPDALQQPRAPPVPLA